MIPWETLGEARTADGTVITLRRRGHEFLILADGRSLMPSTMTGSEQALAAVGCRHLVQAVAPRVLIGGLGMGFTLRAALTVLPPAARVVVAELVPEVVTWNEGPLGPLADHPLRDARVHVEVADALAVLRRHPGGFDAVLLDVDNGPAEFAAAGNDALYSRAGLHSARMALRPGGVLAVWAAGEDRRFVQRLGALGFGVEAVRARGRSTRGARHVIYAATPRASPAP